MTLTSKLRPALIAALLVGLALFAILPGLPAQADTRPNFVIVIADDVSANDLGCYGNTAIDTPNIDRIAAEGILFTNAYLTISSCSPSRSSIITGRYPHNTGASELHRLLPLDQVRFPKRLRDAGYHAVLSGKIHGITEDDPAFDLISDGNWPEHPGASEDWVQLVQDRPKDKPFLFWLASIDAHRDWQFDDDIQRYDPAKVVVPPYMKDTPELREDLAAYYHEITRLDHYVGQVVRVLQEQGVYDNTVILVMADNGRPFLGAKGRLFDSGIKTPFVLRYPELVSAGQTSDSLVSAIDIAPTVLELAGVDKPEAVQGVSFTTLLAEPEATTRDVAFAECNWHVHKAHERLVRFGNFAYIKNNYPTHHTRTYMTSLHDRATGGLRDPESNAPPEQLFDLDQDPHQQVNLANDPAYRTQLLQARKLLDLWTFQTGDSIPEHPTPDRAEGSTPDKPNHNPHREQPGDSMNATAIHHPGPVRLSD
ncbi:MAG: sulfatase [Planctomycetota bacterium]